MKKQNYYKREWMYILFMVVSVFHIGIVKAEIIPPYLSSPIPPPGSSNVSNVTVVTALVVDDGSGVDPDSITMMIDYVIVEPILEPADYGNYRAIYEVPSGHEYEYGARVTTTIIATDRDGNDMLETWQFNIMSDERGGDLELVYPQNNYWMNFTRDGQTVRFSWSKSRVTNYYRLGLTYQENGVSETATVDLGPSDISEAFGIVTANFPVNQLEWDSLASVQSVSWKVASIDGFQGEQLSPYSREYTVNFAPLGAPVLISPVDSSIFNVQTPPTFKWQSNLQVSAYTFGMIRVSESGNFIGEPIIATLPFFITELPISTSNWQLVGNGNWIWTVVATLPDGSMTPCMLSTFSKKQ